MKNKKILIVVNDLKFLFSHRLDVATAAKDYGSDVIIVSPKSDLVPKLESMGFGHSLIQMSRSGQNPFLELWTILRLAVIVQKHKPDVLHLVTIKPVLYGSIVARFSLQKFNVVAAISGLGSVFTAQSIMSRFRKFIIRLMYQFFLNQNYVHIIFQNSYDENYFRGLGVLRRAKYSRLSGSGVKIPSFCNFKKHNDGKTRVLMASRLLEQKGVLIFAEAARSITKRYKNVEFILAGSFDFENPSAITEGQLLPYLEDESINYVGFVRDVLCLLAEVDIACLPSYYGEGLPKFLSEASASSVPIVTTDHPGCRDAVVVGETGLIVPIQNSKKLSEALELLILDREMRINMGAKAYRFACENFDINKIVDKHLVLYGIK